MKLSEPEEHLVLHSAQSEPNLNVAQKPLVYHKACGVLIRKMNKYIIQYTRSENRRIMLAELRSTLSYRINSLLDGQPIYQTYKVIDLYRNRYPESEDEHFVKDVSLNLNEAHWTELELLNSEREVEGDNAGNTTNSGTNDKEETDNKEKESVDGNNPAPAKNLYYFQATKVILKKMNKVIQTHTPVEKHKELVALLRYRIKDRIAAALAGRPVYHTYKVLQLYRQAYKLAEDENFVKAVLEELDENQWTLEDIKKMNPKWSRSDAVEENANGAEAATAQQSGNDPGDPQSGSSEPAQGGSNVVDDESRGIKRRSDTVDDAEAKLPKMWEEGTKDFDMTNDNCFHVWK